MLKIYLVACPVRCSAVIPRLDLGKVKHGVENSLPRDFKLNLRKVRGVCMKRIRLLKYVKVVSTLILGYIKATP